MIPADGAGDAAVNLEDEAENAAAEHKEDVVLKVDVRLVRMTKVVAGAILLTRTYLVFDGGDQKYFRIEYGCIQNIFTRQYLLEDTALEIFCVDGRSFFFDFGEGQRAAFIKSLRRQKLPAIQIFQTTAKDIAPHVKALEKRWSDGLVSNFEFLTMLNVYAGRSYNDLAQYPVFPWVISDYTSAQLDLSKTETFRDLSKPVGALEEERLAPIRERMDGTEPDSGMHYLYRSFYSSSAVILGYLIRLEPFTSLHIKLQSGRFDHADRLFSSIPRAWESVHRASMDFRELIPEFFYQPEFLVNANRFDLGKSGSEEGDVVLPPWAASPLDFVRQTRAALESKHVSAHLHE
jgi:hypothetical protein